MHKKIKWLFGKQIEIPKEWVVGNLDDFQIKSSSGGTPDRNYPKYYEGRIIWIKSGELKDGYIYDSEEKISQEALTSSSAKKFPKKTILVAMYGATIGKTAILAKKGSTNQAICAIYPNPIYNEYFLQQFLIMNRKIIVNFGMGAGQPNISQNIVRKFQYILPHINEQTKIASILSRVDACIEKTLTMMEATERLKKGLMQHLLTKGVGHVKFKKVKWLFGKKIEIPREWEFLKFNVVAQTNPPTKIQNSIVPYVPMDAVDTTKAHFNYFLERKLTDFASLPKFQENDVLFASITPSTENGKTCIVENFPKKGLGSSELTVLRATMKVLPKYLYYYLKSHRIRQYAISQMMGTTGRQRVPDSVFKKDLFFELPSIVEQKKIASILSGVDAYIQKNHEYKKKLEELKKGLMQKLLTGQLRVKI